MTTGHILKHMHFNYLELTLPPVAHRSTYCKSCLCFDQAADLFAPLPNPLHFLHPKTTSIHTSPLFSWLNGLKVGYLLK